MRIKLGEKYMASAYVLSSSDDKDVAEMINRDAEKCKHSHSVKFNGRSVQLALN